MAKHYYISFNGVDFSEIYPMGSPIANAQEWQGTRVWREELEEIKLVRSNNITVYDTLESYFTDKTKFDTELEIEVWSGVRATGAIYYKGLFSISDSSLDTELKTFEIKPRVNDDYYEISVKYDNKYEVEINTSILSEKRVGYSKPLTLGGTTWTNPGVGYSTAYATFVGLGTTISTAITGGIDVFGATLPVSPVAVDDIVIIDVKAYSLSVGVDPTFDIQAGAGNTSVTDEGAKPISTGLHAFTMASTQGAPRLAIEATACTLTGLDFELRTIDSDYDNGRGELLMDFIENFLDSATFMNLTGFTGNVVSTFINNDAVSSDAPSTIDTFMTSYPNGNYVTGEATNKLDYTLLGLLIDWFSVVDKPSYKLSFAEVMDHLRDTLQLYWYIDAAGKFRMEHEKWFVLQTDDSTAITVPATAEVDKHLLKYEKGDIASTEQFAWPQAVNTDFVGNDIIYNNFTTTILSKSYTISQITTDIKYVIDNLDDASDTGMGMYHCNLLTGITLQDIYEIAISTGVLSASAFSNAAFSWANLHDDYWTWSRMSEDATMNGTAITMDSSIRFLRQEGVRFFYSTAIPTRNKIQTDLTGGAPVQIRRDLDTDFVEFVIGYDPYKL